MRMPRHPLSSLVAVGAAASLVLLSAGPGVAATTPVAQGSATGLVLTIAGAPLSTGSFSAVTDGTKQTTAGNDKPTIEALGNQPFLSVGTIAQDATTKVVGKNGTSAACAGLAGDGASLVSAGEGNCLTPGKQLSLSAGTLDLSNVTIVQGQALAGLGTALQTALQPVLNAVLPAIQSSLKTVLTSLGNPDVSLDLGAIQSTCSATPTGATGDSDLADAALSLTIAGQKVDLLALPVHPAPNTKLLTGLDKVVDALNTALTTQLKTGLGGVLAPLGSVANTLLTTINDNVIKAVDKQLAPLENNVLDVTLNEQSQTARSFDVTALDVHVLPAAQAAGLDLLSTQIGHSTCGPNARVVVHTTPPAHHHKPHHPAQHHHHKTPPLPTSVDAGVGGNDERGLGLALLAGLGAVAGATGVASYRRLRRG